MSKQMSPVTVLVNEGAGVSVTGVVDETTVGAVNRAVSEFLGQPDRGELDLFTLDLSTVTMCDHATLQVVRHAQALCAREALALRVIPNEAIRQVMAPRP